MTGSEDVFDDFVRVRWGDLEPAARIVVLDPGAAREVTTTALARLRPDWAETVEGGRPVEAARRLVLTGAVDRAAPATSGGRGLPRSRRSRSGTADPGATPPSVPSLPEDDAWLTDATSPADSLVEALVEQVRGLDPLDRALLAAGRLWGAEAHEVAMLLGLPSADLRRRDRSLRSRLEDAHAAAREQAGMAPAPWALDHDLDAALDVVLRDLTDPPDAAALVGARSRRVRRRTLVAAGASVVALAGVGAVVAVRDGSTPPVAGPVPLPSPGDRSWASTSTWAARGPLAADPSMRTFLSRLGRPGDRILWAGDAGTRRVVVLWTPPVDTAAFGTPVKVFDGPRGARLLDLDPVELVFPYMQSTASVVVDLADADASEGAASSILLALTAPSVTEFSHSRFVRPTRAGRVERDWTRERLEGGVAVVLLDHPQGTAMRVRLPEFEGQAVGSFASQALVPFEDDPQDAVPFVEQRITDATGVPSDRLDTVVLSQDEVPGGMFYDDGNVLSSEPPPAMVVRLRTTTPDGAVIRSSTAIEGGFSMPIEEAVVVPAADADDPVTTQMSDGGSGRARVLVLHPPAATVQLVDDGASGGSRSTVVPCAGRGATVVELDVPQDPRLMRVVLKDAKGRTVYDRVPPLGQNLLDG